MRGVHLYICTAVLLAAGVILWLGSMSEAAPQTQCVPMYDQTGLECCQ